MITVVKLLTRREIIDSWEKQSSNSLKKLCCPSCRSILYKSGDIFECPNDLCEINEIEVGA